MQFFLYFEIPILIQGLFKTMIMVIFSVVNVNDDELLPNDAEDDLLRQAIQEEMQVVNGNGEVTLLHFFCINERIKGM